MEWNDGGEGTETGWNEGDTSGEEGGIGRPESRGTKEGTIERVSERGTAERKAVASVEAGISSAFGAAEYDTMCCSKTNFIVPCLDMSVSPILSQEVGNVPEK